MHVQPRRASRRSCSAARLAGPLLIWVLAIQADATDEPAGEFRPSPDSITAAREVLGSYGLRDRDGVWICREESRWLRMANDLPSLEREFFLSRRGAKDYVARSNKHRGHLAAVQDRYEENRRLQIAGRVSVLAQERFNEQQRRFSLQIAEARQRWRISFDGLREDSEVTQHVRAYAIARLRLEAALLALDRLQPQITNAYQRLESTAAIRDSLEVLAAAEQLVALGPGKDFASRGERGARLRAALRASHVAAYREGLRFRVGAILNDAATVSLRIVEGEGCPIVLSPQLAAAAGLAPVSAGASRDVSVDGRLLRANPYRIETIRIGNAKFSDVEAWVVAEDEDDPGPHMGFDALPGHQLRVDFRQLAVRIGKS